MNPIDTFRAHLDSLPQGHPLVVQSLYGLELAGELIATPDKGRYRVAGYSYQPRPDNATPITTDSDPWFCAYQDYKNDPIAQADRIAHRWGSNDAYQRREARETAEILLADAMACQGLATLLDARQAYTASWARYRFAQLLANAYHITGFSWISPRAWNYIETLYQTGLKVSTIQRFRIRTELVLKWHGKAYHQFFKWFPELNK